MLDTPGGLWVALALVGIATGPAPALAQAGTDVILVTLERSREGPTAGEVTVVTRRSGYDNQPSFSADGSRLYTTRIDGTGQADIWVHEIGSGREWNLTSTPESEYSGIEIPGTDRVAVVRVESDGTQRLWSFARDGGDPQLVLDDLAPVGYHAWADPSTVATFVLGSPPTLVLSGLGDTRREVASGVGRSLHKVPGRAAISFTQREAGADRIRILDLARGTTESWAPVLGAGVDYAWTPEGEVLMGRGAAVYARPEGAEVWRVVAHLSQHGYREVTRLAVSPDGTRMAVVVADPVESGGGGP